MSQARADTLPTRTTAAFLLFIVCCLLSSARIIRDTTLPNRVSTDNIAARSDQRFAALRTDLPSRGVIGYIGANNESAISDYYLAQYALAPLVVDRSINHPLVVGNFTESTPLPPKLDLIKNFGNGVLLFRNKDAR